MNFNFISIKLLSYCYYRRVLYGVNAIEVNVQSIIEILFEEALEPFYIFEVFSLIVWCFEAYFYYTVCNVIMSALSLTTSVVQTRTNQRQFRDTVQVIDVYNLKTFNLMPKSLKSVEKQKSYSN